MPPKRIEMTQSPVRPTFSPSWRVWRLGGSLLAALAVLAGLPGCSPRIFASDPATTGDAPSTNLSTTTRREDVPYCSGGNRAAACAFGANCRVTEQGCQVCQCLSP
jgi:hypothetical protein